MASTLDAVRDYYGRVLGSSDDLKTTACCAAQAPPKRVAEILTRVPAEVLERFYGCGCPLPPALEGATVLDLGCGTGRDCFVLSELVGPTGRVIGIDMTDEQLEVARRYNDRDNLEFVHGYIEDLSAIPDGTVDLVVSNCVINLSPDKPRVLAEVFRVLRDGGELYFSDVFADRRLPEAVRTHDVLVGECLGGALYWEDFRRELSAVGCADARVCATSPIEVTDPELHALVGHVSFTSRTVRAFKLALEDRCEDFGQVAWYLGTIEGEPHAFELDDHHRLEAGRPMLVCGNTADMLTGTRYAPHFRVEGDKTTHFGLFDCGPAPAAGTVGDACC